jgi:hypothetical protein
VQWIPWHTSRCCGLSGECFFLLLSKCMLYLDFLFNQDLVAVPVNRESCTDSTGAKQFHFQDLGCLSGPSICTQERPENLRRTIPNIEAPHQPTICSRRIYALQLPIYPYAHPPNSPTNPRRLPEHKLVGFYSMY